MEQPAQLFLLRTNHRFGGIGEISVNQGEESVTNRGGIQSRGKSDERTLSFKNRNAPMEAAEAERTSDKDLNGRLRKKKGGGSRCEGSKETILQSSMKTWREKFSITRKPKTTFFNLPIEGEKWPIETSTPIREEGETAGKRSDQGFKKKGVGGFGGRKGRENRESTQSSGRDHLKRRANFSFFVGEDDSQRGAVMASRVSMGRKRNTP